MRSPVAAILWEIWRVTRVEAAWKLALGIAGGLGVLGLGATFAPAENATRYERIMDDCAALAMILLVLPHIPGWFSVARLNGGRPGFPFSLHYTRPLRTAVMVGLPMVYLTAMSWAIYLVSAFLLRVTSGYAFPLLPVAVWMAALTVVWVGATWSTRTPAIQLLVYMIAVVRALGLAMERLTAVELPGGYDWPPRLWPALFDFPRTDYAWIALIGLASLSVTIAGVRRQRRGDGWVETPPAQRDGLWDWLVNLFRLPCPTSSAMRAQVWMDLKFNGLPVVTIGVACAVVILLVSAVSGPIDAAINADPRVSCPIAECFYIRAWPPIFAPISLLVVLALGGNAFGIRRKQGRTYVSAFEATHAHGTAQLAALKVLVKSVCVLAAIIAIGASVWMSVPLLGDPVFIQMWNLPLHSRLSALDGSVAALTGYEQLALAVVGVAAVVIWVAALAVFGALWARYSRRVNIAGSLLVLYGLALGLPALAGHRGIGPEIPLGAIVRTTAWVAVSSIVLATAWVLRTTITERLLTRRSAWVAVLASAAFAAAWVTLLRAAGAPLSGMSASGLVWILSPVLLPLLASVLAPWLFSRIRHT